MSFDLSDVVTGPESLPFTRRTLLRSSAAAMLMGLSGCEALKLRSQSPDDDDEIKAPKTTLIGDQVAVSGLHPIQVETVGLVTGLDNTGGDSSPSMWRRMAVEDMKRHGVKNPNTILQSPHTAVVIVRAQLPPVIQVGDPFDVEVELPSGSEATSLKGGWVLPCSLSEQAIVPGRAPMPGHVLGAAEGPIMLSTGEVDASTEASVLKRGRILGGGRFRGGILRKGRELELYLRNDLRSIRQSRRVADAIGKRFFHYDHGIKKALAEAKTDQFIELKVHPSYKENYIRYVHVIRHIALNENIVDRKERMERLRKSLLVPYTASKSATELEAIGNDAILILKDGLKSPVDEVRFYSADALAYLGDSSGVKELAEAARHEEAFRIFALAAMATVDNVVTRDLLRRLMTEPTIEMKDGQPKEVWSAETRYGAFRTLWTIDKRDPFLNGEPLNKGEFTLHCIESDGEPMVHLSTHRVPEVVLFDDQQHVRTPLSLWAGRHILLTARAGSDEVTISRNTVEEDRQVKTSTRLDDIIRAVAGLDASYPDVAQMLVQAQRQENLMGRLEIDALPRAGRFYHRPPNGLEGGAVPKDKETTRVGTPSHVPNMFPEAERKKFDPLEKPRDKRKDGPDDPSDEKAAGGQASLADVSDADDDKADKKTDKDQPEKKRRGLGLFSR